MYKTVNSLLVISVIIIIHIVNNECTLFPYYPVFVSIWLIFVATFYFLKIKYMERVKLSTKTMLIIMALCIILCGIKYQRNRIFYAVWRGDVAGVRQMIFDGSDINRKYNGYYLTEIIFEYGKPISRIDPRYDSPSKIGIKDWVYEVSNMIKLFCENGLDQKNIHIAMYGATSRGIIDLVNYLCDYIDINYLPDFSKDELHGYISGLGGKNSVSLMNFVIDFGSPKALPLLLELKPRLNLSDYSGMNFIEYAEENGIEEKIKIINEHINKLEEN